MADSTVYRDWMNSVKSRWLQGPNSVAYKNAIGAPIDQQVDRADAAVKARFPSTLDAFALQQIGSERQIDQGPTETDAQYADRLRRAWDLWPLAGSPFSILVALEVLGFVAVLVQQNGLSHTLDGSGNLVVAKLDVDPIKGVPWWRFDDNDAFCSRFAVILSADPTADQLAAIRLQIGRWKAAKSTCVEIIALVSGKLWGFPLGLKWGDGTKWGEATTVFRYSP